MKVIVTYEFDTNIDADKVKLRQLVDHDKAWIMLRDIETTVCNAHSAESAVDIMKAIQDIWFITHKNERRYT